MATRLGSFSAIILSAGFHMATMLSGDGTLVFQVLFSVSRPTLSAAGLYCVHWAVKRITFTLVVYCLKFVGCKLSVYTVSVSVYTYTIYAVGVALTDPTSTCHRKF